MLSVITGLLVVLLTVYAFLANDSRDRSEVIKTVVETTEEAPVAELTVEEKKEALEELLPEDPIDTIEEKQEAINLLDQLRTQ